MKGDLRVALAVCSDGVWRAETGACIANLVQSFYTASYKKGEKEIRIFPVGGPSSPEARNRALYEAIQWNATHLMWIAPDVTFPPWTVNFFLSHNELVVAANTVGPTLPAKQTAYVENDETGEVAPLVTEQGERGLVRVKHACFDLMLTDIRVYDKLDLPMFQPEPLPPNNMQYRADYMVFCDLLNAAGIPVVVDQLISQRVDKIGAVVYTHGMADVSQAEMQRRFKAKVHAGFDAEAAE